MVLNKTDLEHLDPRYRVTFVNSLAGYRQAALIGTKSVEGLTNLAVFNSLIHLGAHPALLGLISRPATVQRDTLKNITDTMEYTINYVSAAYYKMAHQTSARYIDRTSEFSVTGFTEAYLAGCRAPFVEESAVKMAMKLEECIPIALNGTVLIIGSISQVLVDDKMIGQDGFIDLCTPEILISQGLDAYFISKEIGRLPYAKP